MRSASIAHHVGGREEEAVLSKCSIMILHSLHNLIYSHFGRYWASLGNVRDANGFISLPFGLLQIYSESM